MSTGPRPQVAGDVRPYILQSEEGGRRSGESTLTVPEFVSTLGRDRGESSGPSRSESTSTSNNV